MTTLLASSLALLLATLTSGTPVEIVLSHCTEETSWVDELGYGAITTSYDKCGNTAGPGRHITKPNVGREGGTYLQHIVDRYDTLADWTVFSQAERPTYGYRGHARGGGHLMSNVKFEDYVLAAKDQTVQPRFFVFTGVVVIGKDDMYQSLRRHYGEGYLAPSPSSNRMCGQSDDWFTGWMKFPTWFKEMIKQLLNEQGVSVSTVVPPELLSFFKVDVDYGVAFFSQGARFAASKEAIMSRPKSYYEDLLRLMSHPDPWAGYFLEWLWFYVLQGPTSPCGFEERLLQSFHSWAQTPARHVEIQAISGNGTDGTNTEISGNTPWPPGEPNIVPGCNNDVIFLANSVTEFPPADPLTMIKPREGDCRGSRMITRDPARIVNERRIDVLMPPDSEGLTLVQSQGAQFDISEGSAGGSFRGLVVECLPNGGPITVSGGTDIGFQDARIGCPKRVGNNANVLRRDGFTTSTYCNAAINAGLTVTDGGAIEFLQNCTLTDDTAFSSRVRPALTHAGASTILVALMVSLTSRPVRIDLWNNPTTMPVAVQTAETSQSFSRNIVSYGNGDEPCPTEWAAQNRTDNCPLGMDCRVFPSVSDTNPDECLLVYSQVFTSPGPIDPAGGDDDDSDEALYGLLALLALIPLLCCCLAAWWWFNNRSVEEPVRFQQPSEEYEYQYMYYPVEGSAGPVDAGMYPSGYDAMYSGMGGEGAYLAPTPTGAFGM